MKSIRFSHRDQRGITLIEMLVVVALMGIIAAGIAMTISQVVAVNSRTSSHMVALRQVQQAGDRVSKDVLQAVPPDLGNEIGKFPLKLTIPYWETDEENQPVQLSHSVNYTLEPMPSHPGLSRLIRSHSSQGTMIVAQYIDTSDSQTWVDWDGAAYQLTFKVTATVGMRS